MNLFTSSSGNNHLHWANSQYDKLVTLGAAAQNKEKRQAIYDEAQRILTETDVPIIPLFISAQNILVKPYVRGLMPNAMELLYLKNVRLVKN